jgi:nitrogen fixation NifU-like protein
MRTPWGPSAAPIAAICCGMWVKFREENGRKVIDRASFQTFGCETAIAVASLATELIAGKTPEEALAMSGSDLAASLGALPPMKIHCAQMVEGALRSALAGDSAAGTQQPPAPAGGDGPGLSAQLQAPAPAGGVRVVLRKSPAA